MLINSASRQLAVLHRNFSATGTEKHAKMDGRNSQKI